jgi:hypothetical protein
MKWKLWLDDLRDPLIESPNERNFIWCRDCAQAMYYVRMWGPPEFMALDHDLGVPVPRYAISGANAQSEDSMKFLRWLERMHPESCPEYRVHSMNPVGQKNIESFMESWKQSLNAEKNDGNDPGADS